MGLLKKHIPYPENVIIELFGDENIEITEDMKDGYYFVVKSLSERYQKLLELRFKEYLTYEKVGKEIGLGADRVSQLIMTSLRVLRNPKNLKYIKYGKLYLEQLAEEEEKREGKYRNILKNKTEGVMLVEMEEISVKTYQSLRHRCFNTLNEVYDFIKEYGRDWYRQIPNLEIRSKIEIEKAIDLYGLNINDNMHDETKALNS